MISMWRRDLGVELENALAQNLQVDDDGVDGILDLVGDAGGEASDGGEAARELDLVFNAADGLGVAHGEQRADGSAALGDEVERELNPASVLDLNLARGNILAQGKGVEHDASEAIGVVEDLFDHPSQHLTAGMADEALGGGADQHDAAVAGEEDESVLQGGHELVEVFLECGEDLADIVHLASEAVDAGADGAEFVGSARARVRAFSVSAVMASRRRAMASKGCSARLERKAAMISENRTATPESSSARLSCGTSSCLRKRVESPTRISPKGRALALHRQGDLIDAGGAVDGAKLIEEAAIAQIGERGTAGHGLVDRAGIGVDQGYAVAVGERRVIDLDVVADDGLAAGELTASSCWRIAAMASRAWVESWGSR